MIILLFKLSILTIIWVMGLTIVTQENMGLYILRDKATDNNFKATKEIYNPLIVCHWCMPSIHSIVGYLAAWGLGIITEWSWKLVLLYPFVVALSSLSCGLIWSFYKLIETSTKYFTNGEKLLYFEIKDRKEEYRIKNNNSNNK